MKDLNLRYKGLTTLEGVTFPKDFECLVLVGNNLTTLEGVIFPKDIEILI